MSYIVSLVTKTVATILVKVSDFQPCHETVHKTDTRIVVHVLHSQPRHETITRKLAHVLRARPGRDCHNKLN